MLKSALPIPFEVNMIIFYTITFSFTKKRCMHFLDLYLYYTQCTWQNRFNTRPKGRGLLLYKTLTCNKATNLTTPQPSLVVSGSTKINCASSITRKRRKVLAIINYIQLIKIKTRSILIELNSFNLSTKLGRRLPIFIHNSTGYKIAVV